MSEWPKETPVFVSATKQQMWDLGIRLGLSMEALKLFKYACNEVELKVLVEENGQAHVMEIIR